MNLTFNLRDAAAPLIGERRFDMDMPLLVGAVALLALGLVMVTSASMEVAAGRLGSPLFYMNRQIVYLLISLVALPSPCRYRSRSGNAFASCCCSSASPGWWRC